MLFKNFMTVFGIVALTGAMSFAGPGAKTETGSHGKDPKVERGEDGKVKGAAEKGKEDTKAVENAGGGKATDFGAAKGTDSIQGADVTLRGGKVKKASDLKQVSDKALENNANGVEFDRNEVSQSKSPKVYTFEKVKTNSSFVLKQFDTLFGETVSARLEAITKDAVREGLKQDAADRLFSQYYEFTLAGTEVLRKADSASGRWAEAVVAKSKADPKSVKADELAKAQKQLKTLEKADATEVAVAKKMDADFVKNMLINGSKIVKFEYTEGGKRMVEIDTVAGEGAGRACMGMSLEAVFKYGQVLERFAGEHDANKMIEVGSKFFDKEFGQGEKESELRMCALASSGCKLFGRALGKACQLKMAAMN